MDLGYCSPRKSTLAHVHEPYCFDYGVTIGLRPTQRWHIIGHSKDKWTIRRHNVVFEIRDKDFIDSFYRLPN